MMKQNTKEFKRNVCCSFFESYLEQAIAIKNTVNTKTAYEHLIAVIEYGLYKKRTGESFDQHANVWTQKYD